MDNSEFLALSNYGKVNYILKKDDSGQYIFNEERRLELLKYINDEYNVEEIALTLSDSNKVSDIVLSKFKKSSYSLGRLLFAIDDKEALKKGLDYYNNDYEKVRIITQEKYSEEERLELITYIDEESYRINVLETIKNNELLKASLDYFDKDYNKLKIINKITDIELRVESGKRLSQKFDRGIVFDSLDLDNKIKYINTLNLADYKISNFILSKDDSNHYIFNEEKRLELLEYIKDEYNVEEIALTLSDSNKVNDIVLSKFKRSSYALKGLLLTIDDKDALKKGLNYYDGDLEKVSIITQEKYSEEERLELITYINEESYRVSVLETIKNNELLRDSLKFLEKEYNQIKIINRITDRELQKEITIMQLGNIKSISSCKSYISNFSLEIQKNLLLKLNEFIEQEKYMIGITDSIIFNEEFSNIKEKGIKYRILTSNNKNISDESRLLFLNEFEEVDRLSIISKMSLDINKINGYNSNPFNDENNRVKFVRLLDDDNKINQLDILEDNINKLSIIKDLNNIDLKYKGLNKIDDYQGLFRKMFNLGDYKLISEFDDEILITIFDSKQLKILNEYKKCYTEGIKNQFSNYIHNHYDLLNEDDISVIAELLLKISISNSEELYKQADSFIENILMSDDPIKKYDKVEKIFVDNHLPYFAKIYLTFLTVHPDFRSYRFDNSNNGFNYVSSPTLNKSSLLHKKAIIFNDLLKCSLGSNNQDFIKYLNRLEYGNYLYLEYKNNSLELTNKMDIAILKEFRNSLVAIYDNSLFRKPIDDTDDLISDISNIDNMFNRKYGNSYTLADRIIGSYCHFVGINTIEDARNYINYHITESNNRNRLRSLNQDFTLEKGDFIKSFDINYFFDMIQNGIVCKDFLGADMSTDGTALDTDLSRIFKDTTGMSISEIIDLKDKDTGFFGQGYIVLKDDPSKIRITKISNNEDGSRCDNIVKSDFFENRVEAFSNGVSTNISNPYGIRTGFSSSLIDYIVFDEKGGIYKDNIYKLIIPMVINGLYIPIISKATGKELFSANDYDLFRNKMNGISYYGFDTYNLSNNIDSPLYSDIINQIDDSNSFISDIKNKIMSIFNESLSQEFKLLPYINGKLSSDELQILDIGSTGRCTNIPYDGDFDFVVRINREIDIDNNKREEFINGLISNFDIVNNGKRINGDIKDMVISIDGKDYKCDLSFARKTNKLSYSSEMCISDRLSTIKRDHPSEYKTVLANIIYAKQFLKQNECYKKKSYGDGGLGGIGVENWILQNGGSFYEASLDFISNAYDDSGEIVPFEIFKEKYKIWDFGENFYTDRNNQINNSKNNLHDDFISNNLTESGYLKMCNCLKLFINSYKASRNNQHVQLKK